MPPIRCRVAIVGCHDHGALAIALAIANPSDAIAGFDADAANVTAARRAAARHRVADRVTFEHAVPHRLLGTGYSLVIMHEPARDLLRPEPRQLGVRGTGSVPVTTTD